MTEKLKKGEIAARICHFLSEQQASERVEEVRIGLSYTAVKFEGGRTGLAAVSVEGSSPGCGFLKKAGSLKGCHSDELLRLLVDGKSFLERALGLATANALIKTDPPYDQSDAIDLMKLDSKDRVAMVGFFPPLPKKIEDRGARLTIIERDPRKAAPLGKKEQTEIMRTCSVAIITATTILNGTIEGVLNDLGKARHSALLGPSTPLIPEVFRDTPVNHLGGALVSDSAEVMRIISEGGGTPAMRPYLKFVNLLWKRK